MTRRTPLVSACLIVKDEEAVLGTCLRALDGLVGEVVVYDTGSTDGTREVAAAAGARVVEGYWDDDFAAARNRALAHCTGEWVMAVDADEVVVADVMALRTALRAASVDLYLLPQDNAIDDGSVWSISVPRLFRRSSGRFAGRIHEQVVDRRTGAIPRSERLDGVRLRHDGYLQAEAKGKRERNVRIAERALTDEAYDGAYGRKQALAHLGRSQSWAGHHDRALTTFAELAATTRDPYLLRLAGASALDSALATGDVASARAWLERLEEAGETRAALDAAAARVLVAEGRFPDALAALGRVPERAVRANGSAFDRSSLLATEICCLLETGGAGEAADRVLSTLRRGICPLPLADQIAVVRAAGRSAHELVEAVAVPLRPRIAADATALDTEAADEVLEAAWARWSTDAQGLRMLAEAAAAVAPRLAVDRALEWALRLRTVAPAAACPLRAVAADTARTPHERVVAAALAFEALGDDAALPLLEEALALVTDADATGVIADLAVVAPQVAAALEPLPA